MRSNVIPMARKTDPETSHQAAHDHLPKLSERRQQVYDLVCKYRGYTSGELSRRFFTEYQSSMSVAAATPHKRLPELETLGYVQKGPTRTCRDSGYKAHTWWPVLRQRELFS